MSQDVDWASYLGARRAALSCCADPDAGTIGRAERRLRTHLGMGPDEAHRAARRCFLYAGDAAFHDQLLASGRFDILHRVAEMTPADPLGGVGMGGTVAVSLHYGPATSILPLWLARASHDGLMPAFGVIQNSRSNPSVMLPPERQAALAKNGFPLVDLDIARLGEIGALRSALAILNTGGTVLIFADGQLPTASAKRTVACRLGDGALALAHGAQWLARSAGAALLPLLVRPTRESHRVVSLPAMRPENAAGAYQALIDAAMGFDPAPWSRWCCSAEHF
jgi:hypothetical protein